MKVLPLMLPLLLATSTSTPVIGAPALGAPALGESPVRTFDEADFNADGILNKREADTALPALAFQDEDDDGVITRADVRRVLPDIQFPEDAPADGPIGAPEYREIVDTIRDMLSAGQPIR